MMQLDKRYNYNPIPRIDTPNGRFYVEPLTGNHLPSVTTILAKTNDMTHINEWQEKIGEDKAKKIVKESSDLGTNMHKNLENYMLGIPMSGSFMAKALANLIIKKGLSKIDKVFGIEVSLFEQGLYAGTTDLIAQRNDKIVIVDFKNSRNPKKIEWIDTYKAQLGAYCLMHNSMYGTDVDQGLIMVATRDAEYQEFFFEGQAFEECKNLWLSRLEQYYEAINK